MYKWRSGLGDSSDSVTIVIVTVTIIIVIAIMTTDMWLRACVFDVDSSQHTHNYMKKHVEITNISNEFNLDKEFEVFSVGGLKEWYIGSTWFLCHKCKIFRICTLRTGLITST